MAEALKIRLFAPLSEVVGQHQVSLPVSGPLTAGEVFRRLGEIYPALVPFLADDPGHEAPALLAVNGRAASPGDVVRPGDDLFLAPQVSGG
ncbi:MAG: MoaD/ThiS family protein [Chloroflexota bacterium]